MTTQPLEEHFARLNRLSEGLFGEAADVDQREAEELLKIAGIDAEKLRSTLYERMRQKSEEYAQADRPVPPLVQQALEDLRGVAQQEIALAGTARLAIARLLEEIRELPSLLERRLAPTFTAAYRNKKQLSAHDKKLLDDVGDDLRRRIEGRKTK